MGAFEALLALRKGAAQNPSVSIEKIAELISRIEADAASLDFESGLHLHSVVSEDAKLTDPSLFYRACIFDVIVTLRTAWSRTLTLGRERFYSSLDRDQQQCLRAANLMLDPVTDDIVLWWDRLSVLVRQATDDGKYTRGRQAERLTLAHETDRLAKLGIESRPRWISIEDNGAGYDVLSYMPGAAGPVNLLIEVKSTIASPLRFIVSRNEWKKALVAGDLYIFHVWDLAATPPRLHQRNVKQIAPHVPDHKEKGEWLTAEIYLSAQ